MPWTVFFHPDFDVEVEDLDEAVRIELLAMVEILKAEGPLKGRPHVDTLAGSNHANMKELRFNAAGGVWRAAFAFDPARQAVVLVAGDKSGVSRKRFYKRLIGLADRRFTQWLKDIP